MGRLGCWWTRKAGAEQVLGQATDPLLLWQQYNRMLG